MDEVIILTDNGEKVLKYMQSHDEILVGKEIGEATGVKGVYPVLQSLIKRNLVVMDAPVIRNFTNTKGIVLPKEYKTYKLTDKGRSFIIN